MSMASSLRSFRPSLSAPVLALVTTLLLLQSAAKNLESAAIEADLSRRYVDDASYVEHVLQHFVPPDPAIVFLGGSVTREGVPDEPTLARQLGARSGHAFTVRNLAFSSFSPVESIAIVDTLRVPTGSSVVLQLGWQNLTESREDVDELVLRPRIALLDWRHAMEVVSPATRLQVALTPTLFRHSSVVANYLDQRSCSWHDLLQVENREICTRPRSVVRSFYSEQSRLSDADKRGAAAVAHAELVPRALANSVYAESVYVRFIELTRSRGLQPVLLLFPRDQSESELMRANGMDVLEEGVVGRLDAIVDIVDLRGIGNLDADDFADPLHLLETGRLKVLSPLVTQLGGIIDSNAGGKQDWKDE